MNIMEALVRGKRIMFEGQLRAQGVHLVDGIDGLFKVRAKSLHRALREVLPKAGLMSVQEALAKAVGFSNTHALQELTKRVREGVDSDDMNVRWDFLVANGALLDQMMPLLLAGLEFEGSTPLDGDEMLVLEDLAQKLAPHLHMSVDQTREAVAKAWADEPTWEGMTTRTPLTKHTTEPLVTFVVREDLAGGRSTGSLELSEEAHWLWDNVLGSDGDLEPGRPIAEIVEVLKKAKELTDKHPEFFISYFAVAGILEEHFDALGGTWSNVVALNEAGVKAAEMLMPTGFKGKVNWYEHGNRPYLRGLLHLMNLHLRSVGSEDKALKMARKFTRRCTDVAFADGPLAVLEALVKGNTLATQKAIKVAQRSGSGGSLNAAVAQLLIGESTGMTGLVEAILEQPVFGAILLGDGKVRPLNRKYKSRGVSYEDPKGELLAVLAAQRARVGFADWMRRVLSDRELLAMEEELESSLVERSGWREWKHRVRLVAPKIADDLVARYGVPPQG